VPDFISSGSQQIGLERIKQSLESIKFNKDDRVVLACNTAHILLPEIERLCKIRFVSLTDAAIEAVTRRNLKKVGVLASPMTFKVGLYEKPLQKKGIEVVTPGKEELDLLENAIREVIANKPATALAGKLKPIISRMRQSGAENIILGCTELSVIFGNTQDKTLIDPLNEICKQLIEV